MISPSEVRRVLQGAGFEDVRTFNGMEAREAAPIEGPRTVAVARKPAA